MILSRFHVWTHIIEAELSSRSRKMPVSFTCTVSFRDNHQEYMLYSFLANDAVLKEYQAIQENVNDSAHVVKRIMMAMRNTLAKTVNVTILKNGCDFTFKTEADCLRWDCTGNYPTWDIITSDRKEFQQVFGRSVSYTPQEILRIAYGKKVLYEAERQA